MSLSSAKDRLGTAISKTLQQLLILAVLVLGVSWVNTYSERLLQGLMGSSAARWLFASIGTPVHEASHALMALLFGYRIVEFRPFIADPSSSMLGYVRYSYVPGGFISQIGHFFVGIAPVFLPFIVLYLLYRWLLPSGIWSERRLHWRRLFHIRTLLFVYLFAQIVLHMRSSPADLQNALYGLPFLLLLIFLIGLIWPRALDYLQRNSIRLTVLALAFAGIDFLLVRGALFLIAAR